MLRWLRHLEPVIASKPIRMTAVSAKPACLAFKAGSWSMMRSSVIPCSYNTDAPRLRRQTTHGNTQKRAAIGQPQANYRAAPPAPLRRAVALRRSYPRKRHAYIRPSARAPERSSARPARGGPCISQRQNTQPRSVNTAAPSARCSGWWLSSGDSTPAINAFDTRLVNACSDDAAAALARIHVEDRQRQDREHQRDAERVEHHRQHRPRHRRRRRPAGCRRC